MRPLLSEPARVSAKPLSSAALVVYAFALALGVGIGSAYVAVSGEYPVGALRVDPWTA